MPEGEVLKDKIVKRAERGPERGGAGARRRCGRAEPCGAG